MSGDPRLGGHTCGPECDHGPARADAGPPTSRVGLMLSDDYTYESLALAANGVPWRASDADPTGTTQIRKRYEGEMYRRFRALKGAILESVVELDAFGLTDDDPGGPTSQVAALTEDEQELLAHADDAGIDIEPAGPRTFDYPADSDKVDSFNEWLDTQVDRGILERGKHERGTAASRSWQNTYIRSAYERGVNHADESLVEAGVIPPEQTLDDVFRATKHVDGAGLIYTRAYNELRGVTQDMGREMTRELTDGFTQGENPRKIARRLNDRVDNVGLHRGRLIARTETNRAHNEAGLNRYEDMGDRIDGVSVVAEHTTAGDSRVCPICLGLAGKRYKLKEARGRIPVHPNCRCTFVPIQKSNTAKGGPAGDLSRPERLAQRTRDADSSGEIGDAISDEYDFGAAGFENLDADEAESFARAIARLDDDGEIDKAPSEFSRIRVTDEDEDTNAMGDYFFNTSDDTTEMRIHRQNLDRERMNELISDGWQYGDPDDDALEQLFVHEWGHVRHHEALKSDEYLDLRSTLDRVNSYDPDMPDDVEQAARQDISDYSETNSWELVAETYTKRTLGSNDHTDRINEFYDEMFGPEPGDLGDAGDRLAVTDNTLRRERGTMNDDEDLPSELADSADSVSETFETLAENADDADE